LARENTGLIPKVGFDEFLQGKGTPFNNNRDDTA